MKTGTSKSAIHQLEEDANDHSSGDSTNDDQQQDQSSTDTSIGKNDTSTPSGGSSENRDKMREALTSKDTKNVFRLRLLVVFIMIVVAITVCVLVYKLTYTAETQYFSSQYEGASSILLDAFESIIHRSSSISAVGIAAKVHRLDRIEENASWPFVTMNFFEHRASFAKEMSGALYIAIKPIVSQDNRAEWEGYVTKPENKRWLQEGILYGKERGLDGFERNPPPIEKVLMLNMTQLPIVYRNSSSYGEEDIVDPGPGPYLPTWQFSPFLLKQRVNENSLKNDQVKNALSKSYEEGLVVIGQMQYASPGSINDVEDSMTEFYATVLSITAVKETSYKGDPMAHLYIPILNSFDRLDKKTVAVLDALINWQSYFRDLLPVHVKGLTIVLDNTCDNSYTYRVDGPTVTPIGSGDLHEIKYGKYRRIASFAGNRSIYDGSPDGLEVAKDGCLYSARVYPTQMLEDEYHSNTPILVTLAVAVCFAVIITFFYIYDKIVQRRQSFLLAKAVQSTDIVTSLFPGKIRDRLLEDDNQKVASNKLLSRSNRIQSYLSNGASANNNEVMSDLFPNCTVLFADIAGFTAWSSTRDPDHVFILLQTVFQGFDAIAKRRKVFKVETIGDCYLAVTGLPEPQVHHALIMARFAWECKHKMCEMTSELEVKLGPDCSDLKMRFGMHSGPVTAGVLRGERARFQLFGDTVNTAARMESTGICDKIHISQATADLLRTEGKGRWVIPREDQVEAKGKGVMHTFWLNPSSTTKSRSGSSNTNSDSSVSGVHGTANNDGLKKQVDLVKHQRNIDWMVELLLDNLRKIFATRPVSERKFNKELISFTPSKSSSCLDEVKEIIEMVKFNPSVPGSNPRNVQVDPAVVTDLRSYVSIIATMYREDNPFHNFEHACHVTMSVSKLLKRIMAPEVHDMLLLQEGNKDKVGEKSTLLAKHLHNCSHGITSDPLAVFAIVFSALIHDVDHRGCSNDQLGKEEEHLGLRYRYKSIAEQNSVDLAWTLLMSDTFTNLRNAIFGSNEELHRFRQLVVNTVLATDIFDKELNDLRKSRWAKAFSEKEKDCNLDADRKATIVIEHIIQASDVSHTMQHWHVYRKWNSRLFQEMYLAYQAGRMTVDPSTFWYHGELAFFDNYIIPLANKLKECNVFGVSSDEYLDYALGNRAEWMLKGEGIVAELLQGMATLDE